MEADRREWDAREDMDTAREDMDTARDGARDDVRDVACDAVRGGDDPAREMERPRLLAARIADTCAV